MKLVRIGSARLARGARGVWTIEAPDPLAAFRAVGWTHGRDRPFQLDLARRAAAGCLAEWVGRRALPHDIRQRTLGLRAAAERILGELPERHLALLEAYAEGIEFAVGHRWWPSCTHALFGRWRPWTPVDSLLVMLSLCQGLCFDFEGRAFDFACRERVSTRLADFLMTASRDLPPEDVPKEALQIDLSLVAASKLRGAASADRGVRGSNCWTLPPGRTASGVPILAADLHLSATMPGPLHRVAMVVAGRRIDGAATVGLPILVVGSNGRVAWGLTNHVGDTLRLTPSRSVDTPFHERGETIRVRAGATHTVVVRESDHGPEWPEAVDGEKVCLRWSLLLPGAIDLGLVEVAFANSAAAAADIARRAGGPPLVFHAADADGATMKTLTGRIPVATGRDDAPFAFAAAEDIPVRCGGYDTILVSANERDHPVEGGAVPDGWNQAPSHRAMRIRDLASSWRGWREVDAWAMQRDVVARYLDPYRDLCRQVAEGDATRDWPTGLAGDVRAAVEGWDGTLEASAIGAPLIHRFRRRLTVEIYSRLLSGAAPMEPATMPGWRNTDPVVLALLARLSVDGDRAGASPSRPDLHAFLAGLLREETEDLLRHYRVDISRLTWGATVHYQLTNPLSSIGLGLLWRALPLLPRGGDDCIFAVQGAVAPMMSIVVSPGREEDGLCCMPGGQSESPFSKHYNDHHSSWCDGFARPLREACEP